MKMLEAAGSILSGFKGRVVRSFNQNKPEIALATGSALIIGSVVLACKATYKVDDVIEEHRAVLDKINQTAELLPEKYTKNDAIKDKVKLYAKTGTEFLKIYGPALLTLGSGLALIFYSHGLMKGRNAALITVVKGLEHKISSMEERMVKELGPDKAHEIIGNTKAYDEARKAAEEASESEDIKVSGTEDSPCELFFDENSVLWKKNATENSWLVRGKQKYHNTMLHTSSENLITLNDVRKSLGYDPIYPEGEEWVWYYLKDHPVYGNTYVNFGLCDPDDINYLKTLPETTQDFILGRNRYCLLRMNCTVVDWDSVRRWKRERLFGRFTK